MPVIVSIQYGGADGGRMERWNLGQSREILLGHCAGCLASTISLNPLITREASSSISTVGKVRTGGSERGIHSLKGAQLVKNRTQLLYSICLNSTNFLEQSHSITD